MTLKIEAEVPLAPFTTLRIGGPARLFARVHDVDELREALEYAKSSTLPLLVLGGGSNVLIADRGFDGLAILMELRGITVESVDSVATVRVAAGERWDEFVAFAVERGWAGIECLSGIPGSTGATPIQNVGAYGQDVSETISRVEVLDRASGIVKTLTNDECRFSYRNSVFKSVEPDRYIVLAMTFRLRPGGEANIRYPELRQYLDERGINASDLQGVRDAVIAIRRRKGMVLDDADHDTWSDGSFFTNPILDASSYERFVERARRSVGGDARIPAFPSDDGSVKLSAAWLIEHAGFQKGTRRGNVSLSTKHTLAITNRGDATAAEVVALVEEIKAAVRDAFGVELHPEPNFIGF